MIEPEEDVCFDISLLVPTSVTAVKVDEKIYSETHPLFKVEVPD